MLPPAAQTRRPPPPKVFARGQFTFNRRFFETQLPGFFAMTRPEAERDTVLTFQTTRSTDSPSADQPHFGLGNHLAGE